MTRAEFCAFARAHDNFVILTHRRPDGDTIGSASALCLGLRQLGKTAFVLTNEQFTWLMNFIRFCRKEGKIHVSYGCEGFLGNYEAEMRDSIFQCNAGINTASVLADGAISGCPSIRANFHQGNIYKDDFIDIWNNEFKPYRNRQWAKKGECADCKMFRYCEGNGMHLYDDEGNLLVCHYKRLVDS